MPQIDWVALPAKIRPNTAIDMGKEICVDPCTADILNCITIELACEDDSTNIINLSVE